MIFIIGNGESRKGIDLNSLKEKGKTYGCNALYRDFSPDCLISMDTNMVVEIISSGYCKNNQCMFSEWATFTSELYENFHQETDQIIYIGEKDKAKEFSVFGNDKTYVVWVNDEKISPFENNFSLDAGTNAIKIATEDNFNCETIYLLGFDMRTNKEKNNNIYKDTECYSSTDSKMINIDKWINENKVIMERNPSTLYCRVDNTKTNPKEWSDLLNVRCISYDEFWTEINDKAIL